MKNKAMRAVMFLAVAGTAFMAGRPDNDISGAAGSAVSQVSSAAGEVWGFLGSRAETDWAEAARVGSCTTLVVGAITVVMWGLTGVIFVASKEPFPSLVGHIWKATDSSVPVWAVLCIPVVCPFEGAARLICGTVGAFIGLMTFDTKRLIRK